MPRKHQAEEHYQLIDQLVLSGHRWVEIVAKLAALGVKTSESSLIHFYTRRRARIAKMLKERAEELATRKALAAQELEDMKARGRALEAVCVAHSAAHSVVQEVKQTQLPASRQAGKAAAPQMDTTAIFASALESIESQKSARIIR